MSHELVTQEPQALTAGDLRAQVNLVQEVMKAVMRSGEHYGTIPGCGPKPTLLKPGAEKLMMTFRLAVEPEIHDLSDPDNGYVKYRVVTKVTAQSTGRFLGAGVGECSSEEDKYGWRKAVCEQEWQEADPVDRREKWSRSREGAYQVKQVKTNPADVANTVLKMAKKRSLVDAVLTVTAASDIFTQDVEDMPEEVREPQAKSTPAQPAQQPSAGLVYPFGQNKGKPLSEVPMEALSWAIDTLRQNVEDKAKAKYKEKNQALLQAMQAEVARRQPKDSLLANDQEWTEAQSLALDAEEANK